MNEAAFTVDFRQMMREAMNNEAMKIVPAFPLAFAIVSGALMEIRRRADEIGDEAIQSQLSRIGY